VFLVHETSLPAVLAHVAEMAPDVLAIDSIQTVHDPDSPGAPGSVGQVRDAAQRLVQLAKLTGIVTLLVGHVTKDGALAGPRVLEHVVDTVLSFEGDRHHSLRMLRALKHRFGSTDELGLMEMGADGCNPSRTQARSSPTGGRRFGPVVAPVLEGARLLCVEVRRWSSTRLHHAPPSRGDRRQPARDAARVLQRRARSRSGSRTCTRASRAA
jgi:DNA repair protein RadA/Sms